MRQYVREWKAAAGLLRGMSKTAFSGRTLGEALDVTLAMVDDPGCKVVLTLSGAMTIAKMGKVISKMIDTGMVQAVVSTGALMAHGLSEAVGMVHYRHDPRMSDEELVAFMRATMLDLFTGSMAGRPFSSQ